MLLLPTMAETLRDQGWVRQPLGSDDEPQPDASGGGGGTVWLDHLRKTFALLYDCSLPEMADTAVSLTVSPPPAPSDHQYLTLENPWQGCVLYNWCGGPPPLYAQRLWCTHLATTEDVVVVLTASHRAPTASAWLGQSRHRRRQVLWNESRPCAVYGLTVAARVAHKHRTVVRGPCFVFCSGALWMASPATTPRTWWTVGSAGWRADPFVATDRPSVSVVRPNTNTNTNALVTWEERHQIWVSRAIERCEMGDVVAYQRLRILPISVVHESRPDGHTPVSVHFHGMCDDNGCLTHYVPRDAEEAATIERPAPASKRRRRDHRDAAAADGDTEQEGEEDCLVDDLTMDCPRRVLARCVHVACVPAAGAPPNTRNLGVWLGQQPYGHAHRSRDGAFIHAPDPCVAWGFRGIRLLDPNVLDAHLLRVVDANGRASAMERGPNTLAAIHENLRLLWPVASARRLLWDPWTIDPPSTGLELWVGTNVSAPVVHGLLCSVLCAVHPLLPVSDIVRLAVAVNVERLPDNRTMDDADLIRCVEWQRECQTRMSWCQTPRSPPVALLPPPRTPDLTRRQPIVAAAPRRPAVAVAQRRARRRVAPPRPPAADRFALVDPKQAVLRDQLGEAVARHGCAHPPTEKKTTKRKANTTATTTTAAAGHQWRACLRQIRRHNRVTEELLLRQERARIEATT